MRILITGASGFVGRALVARLLSADCPLALAGAELVLLDVLAPECFAAQPRCRIVTGSLADPACVRQAFAAPVDLVFHLASVPGGTAEREFELGRAVNVDGTMLLLDHARASGRVPRFVFASSIAALGITGGGRVTDDTLPAPATSYGAQKLIGETWVRDFARRGWIDGVSLRLCGIVSRPPQRTGHVSAFMSDVIRELANARAYVCPVSADATLWLMSVPCVVSNLLHAATVALSVEDNGRAFTLPAQRMSIGQLVAAVGRIVRRDVGPLIRYAPDPAIERLFGRHPELSAMRAAQLGFTDDGDADALVRNALIDGERA
jgi:D-erythronate 2-dehydrogenase